MLPCIILFICSHLHTALPEWRYLFHSRYLQLCQWMEWAVLWRWYSVKHGCYILSFLLHPSSMCYSYMYMCIKFERELGQCTGACDYLSCHFLHEYVTCTKIWMALFHSVVYSHSVQSHMLWALPEWRNLLSSRYLQLCEWVDWTIMWTRYWQPCIVIILGGHCSCSWTILFCVLCMWECLEGKGRAQVWLCTSFPHATVWE